MAESETQEQGAMGEKARSASAARQRNGRRADGLDGDLQARARATTGAAKLGKGKERWKLYPVKGWPGIYRRGEPDSGPYVVVVRVGKRGQVKRTCRTLAEARVVQAELRRSAPGANSFRRGATPFTIVRNSPTFLLFSL